MGKLIREFTNRQDEAGGLEGQVLAERSRRLQVSEYRLQSLTTLASNFRLSPLRNLEVLVSENLFYALVASALGRSGCCQKDFRGERVPGSLGPPRGMERSGSGHVIGSKLRKGFEILAVKSVWTRRGRSAEIALSPSMLSYDRIPESLGGDI